MRARGVSFILGLSLHGFFLLGGCDAPPEPADQAHVPKVAPAPPSDSANADPPGRGTGPPVARTSAGVLLSEGDLVDEVSRLPPHSRSLMNAEGRRRFVDTFALNELLFEEGTRRGLDSDPQIERQVRDLRKRLVVQKLVMGLQKVPPIRDEEVRAYYDANRGRYSTTTIRARHILIKDEAKARALHAELEEHPERFADLARASSEDAGSARQGGELGVFGHGRMPAEFEKVAFALRTPGEISEVVQTPEGFHIIQLEERRPGEQREFAEVEEQIRLTMRNEAVKEQTTTFYEEIKQRAGLEIDAAAVETAWAKVPPPKPAAGPVRGIAGH